MYINLTKRFFGWHHFKFKLQTRDNVEKIKDNLIFKRNNLRRDIKFSSPTFQNVACTFLQGNLSEIEYVWHDVLYILFIYMLNYIFSFFRSTKMDNLSEIAKKVDIYMRSDNFYSEVELVFAWMNWSGWMTQ